MLNPEQNEAVTYTDGPLLVLAGAGSGKTRVIIEKIGYLIREKSMPASAIAAITFTNKSAREMRERVARSIKTQAEGLTISTFHAFGLNFLRQEYALAGLPRQFTLLDEDDTEGIVKDLLPKGSKADQVRLFRGLISTSKNAQISVAKAQASARSPRERELAHLYAGYQRRLGAFNALDFDDLICRPLQVLTEHDAARTRWQHKLSHILVDEYQDTNDAQYALLKLLTGSAGCFTAVGDDDQSIYAWRGANPGNLNELARDYPALRVIKLEQNYRCSGRILAAANAVIANNPHLYEKRLWSAHPAGDKLRLKVLESTEAEAEFVAATITNTCRVDGATPNQFAVLYRGNHQARALELALRALAIPYHLSGSLSFFDRAEIKDLCSYLRLLVMPTDDAAFLRAIRKPKRDVGDTSLERLAEVARLAHLPLLQAASQVSLMKSLTPRAAGALQQFAALIARTTASADTKTPAQLCADILEHSGMRREIESENRDQAVTARRLENVEAFLDWLRHNARTTGLGSLERALVQLSLNDREEADAGNVVRLMTMHSAKGLEFDHVLVVGLEDGTLPHQSAIDENRLDEERRLFYVALTRARQTLTLSRARRRQRFGSVESATPSRFLDELPAEHLLTEDDEVSPERAQAVANAHMADIRALLDL